MSILIEGMDKPKDCSYCILANKHVNGLCEAKYYCRLEADFEHCPLVDIDDIRYEAFKEFERLLLKKIENHILYGEENR